MQRNRGLHHQTSEAILISGDQQIKLNDWGTITDYGGEITSKTNVEQWRRDYKQNTCRTMIDNVYLVQRAFPG